MKQMLIRYFILLNVLLGGYFQLHARTHGELISPLSQTTLKVLEEKQPVSYEGINHHNKDFVVTNSFSFQYFVKTLFENTDNEKEGDEDNKENRDSKLKKLSAKKSIKTDFDSYISISFYSKTAELQRTSLFKKTTPVYSATYHFSSDDRLYVIFENFRI